MITNMQKAKAQVVLNQPFFANILLKRELIQRDDLVPTMGVDKRGNIYYNKQWCDKLDVQEFVFLLCHEACHVIAQHLARRGNRNAKGVTADGSVVDLWQIASDAWINDTLIEADVGKFIVGGVNIPGSKGKTTEQIYDELVKQTKDNGPAPSNSLGEEFVDTGDEPTEEELKEIESSIKVDVASAAAAARSRGKLSPGLDRLVNDLIHVQTPWFEILERFMFNTRNTDNTWRQPNRRYHAHGHYLPSRKSEGTMGEVVLGIDTSSSIGSEELNFFASHINRIIELCKPEKTHVVYCDSQVQHTEVFEDGEEILLHPKGGGGTTLTKIFDWVKDEALEPSCIVILTDGLTDFPDEVDHPTIWAITSPLQAPSCAGETVNV